MSFLAVINCTSGYSNCDLNLPHVVAGSDNVRMVVQFAFGVIGALAVIYIIYAGIRISMSQGDPQTIAKSRQAIIFALVGLVVAVSAEIIVSFVLGRL